MRKWYLPATIAGLGGLGLYLMATRGRETMRCLLRYMDAAPDTFREFNEAAEREIANLQSAVDELARSLRPTTE
jgi:hypothetical protein